MKDYECACPTKRTDGLPPCGKAVVSERPDGVYCDCGHGAKCCFEFGLAMAKGVVR